MRGGKYTKPLLQLHSTSTSAAAVRTQSHFLPPSLPPFLPSPNQDAAKKVIKVVGQLELNEGSGKEGRRRRRRRRGGTDG